MSTEVDIASPQPLRHLKSAAAVALMVAAGIVSGGVFSRVHAHQELATWTDAQAIPTVATVLPQASPASEPLVLPGRLAAYINAPIYARVSGYLHAWYADIGTHVKAGQLLGVIDTPDLDQQLQQARADLQNSVANEKLAATTAKRWTEMLKQDSVSQQEADEKTSDLIAKQATVEANEANVRRLEALESFKRLTAPFDGVVTARKTDVGALIDAGSGSGPELFTVSDASQLRVYVSVPQSDAASIKAGMHATLTVPERPGIKFDAKLVDTDQSISPASGTMLVQLAVDNKQGMLFPGEYTEVHLAMPGDAHALFVPASTLIFRAHGMQVAVADANRHVQLRDVTIGTDLGTRVEITSGLHAGERVIDNPPDSLASGDLVRLASANAPGAPGAQSTQTAAVHDAERAHG
ncbi:efflux RND transporter periplasmic adaptor subunit [Paraburkholderia unamae]|uniref:RND family efflux transporter MFP subunit n=1 Tax=Paraburkholderia unamae TaxID=219649 RepID=A0ABX5KLG4_9BURK|nr:efflux RND transporter periplasmic adaptor subunit [Paraburkholderia unamae]PVX82643.1 RND family efflux transporter MFP subunit [Paraburkholderia unamae]RAR51369.1 RND family efflux transporter MFP subunit [Paraburkholderia unamae]CAG9267501.1 RND family efflux transporter MFP subunit [Paraburkholderia unamae]